MDKLQVRHAVGAVILLVEDESIVAMDIQHQLEGFGCSIAAWATTGEEAIPLAEKIRPDLVIMDISLAGNMSGIEAAAAIKERCSLPVLFLTANSDLATVENALGVNPIGYILKPFEKRELEVAVEMALYRSLLERNLKSALHQAELERAKTEAIIAGIGMGLCIFDTEFRVLYQNQIHREMFHGDKAGSHCFESLRNRTTVCEGCPLALAFETGRVETAELEYVHGDTVTFLDVTASPILGLEGTIVSGVELVKDITHRKQMERALAESEERYRKLVEYTPTGIVTVEDGVIGFVNPAGISLFGASGPDDLTGRPLLDFIHPDGKLLFSERLFSADSEPQQIVGGKLLRSDGHNIDIEASFAAFLSGGRNMVQVIINNISERTRTEQIIRQMAYYDTLTSLPNRRLFDDRIHLALTQARRYGRQFAILFIDLDNFKDINDRLGHTVGDELLKEVAKRLRNCCRRESETVARFGGDEFIILLPEITGIDEVKGLIRKVFRAFQKKFTIQDKPLATNLSIGISIFPLDGEDSQTLVMHADYALYRAKAEGRNTYRFYNEALQGACPL